MSQMDPLEYIDEFYASNPGAGEKAAFHRRVKEDKAFAEQVIFYLAARQAAKNKAVEQGMEATAAIGTQMALPKGKTIAIRRWLVAASVLLVVVSGALFLLKSPSPARMADRYIEANFNQLSVTMATGQDSLQTALRLYNEKDYAGAERYLDSLVSSRRDDYGIKKIAGIVSLRLTHYGKALAYFTQLEKDSALYANPGKFYRAIALMKRNAAGDEAEAKKLLETVVAEKREGSGQAKEWLQKW